MAMRKKIAVGLVILLIALAGFLYFFIGKNENQEYKGTFVQNQCKEDIL